MWINAAVQANRILLDEVAGLGVKVPIPVVPQSRLIVRVLALEADRLVDCMRLDMINRARYTIVCLPSDLPVVGA